MLTLTKRIRLLLSNLQKSCYAKEKAKKTPNTLRERNLRETKNKSETERNLRETRAIAAFKKNPNYFYKFVKKNSTIRAGIGPLHDEEANLEPDNNKNERASSALRTQQWLLYKYPNYFFGHPHSNTLSDINITREAIIDEIKTIS